MQVRDATAADAPRCVDLVEARRLEYQRYEPRFWRKAENSAASTLPWFETLFSDARNVCLVAVEGDTLVGFVVARAFPTPPVYAPGGPTAMIDDFCVVSKDRWRDVGQALLDEARARLRQAGFAQVVVVGARQDLAKTRFLEQTDLSLASTWWTTAV